MPNPSSHEVTQLLVAWGNGDQAALDQLVPLIQTELHRLARHYMNRERPGHTLQTSALVNEAYVRLINWKEARFQNRAHFFGVSAQIMRHILMDFARRRPHSPEGVAQHVTLEEARVVFQERDPDLLALDEALNELAKLDPRKSKIVELRFFGGLSVEETAAFLDISAVTVMREWARAKAWLYRELNNKDDDAP